jgi:DNA (cytosine-5)-methyltransferase 1
LFKVVDIFAGPGGLSEGFSSVFDAQGQPAFDVALSIEKEPNAHETLTLRAFVKSFLGRPPDDYYRFLRREIDIHSLYSRHPHEAHRAQCRCWLAELGASAVSLQSVRERVRDAIGDADNWVLIGGPPCQAYSIAGRSRNQGKANYDPATDIRQRLYVEYLQILADHRPAVFIMENVKGLLSATLKSEHIFSRILSDLRTPAAALSREGRLALRPDDGVYRIYSLVVPQMFEDGEIEGCVVRAEHYGIPQSRHRIILMGIRNDLESVSPATLTPYHREVHASEVLESLPPLRSGLSREPDSPVEWTRTLQSQADARWAAEDYSESRGNQLHVSLQECLASIEPPPCDRGAEYIPGNFRSRYASEWYSDDRLKGICNHRTRAHMRSDLHRYVYAACFARVYGRTPALRNFPKDLLPAHTNIDSDHVEEASFADRFRVQLAERSATTVVSHIGKDGHYYIHYDPAQCRSLTVREAARLQTFPDNYFFCGSMTSQYTQVGNAVPPLLARQIGEIVLDVLRQAGDN